jgi:curved DNA-binding protein CbpA
MNPFDALGLPARPDLDDEQVRGAWRAIAAATHPDRPDGGDAVRYTAAASAYAQLRSPWGRSEAYADLTAATDLTAAYADLTAATGLTAAAESATVPLPAVPDAAPPPGTRAPAPARTVWLLPARVRRGRPIRFSLRATAGLAMSVAVMRLIPGQPAAPAAIAGIITWFLLTGRADLAPPPGR